MLKMMIPLPAVKQQVMKDGLNPNILDCDHDKPLPKVIPGDASKAVPGKKKKVRSDVRSERRSAANIVPLG